MTLLLSIFFLLSRFPDRSGVGGVPGCNSSSDPSGEASLSTASSSTSAGKNGNFVTHFKISRYHYDPLCVSYLYLTTKQCITSDWYCIVFCIYTQRNISMYKGFKALLDPSDSTCTAQLSSDSHSPSYKTRMTIYQRSRGSLTCNWG